MQNGILSNLFNTKSETVNNAVITFGNIDDTGKGKHFTSRFIQPGLVKIEGHGIVLLKKETIDQSLKSMIGTPVIIKHQDVTEDNADELRCGVIANAYFNDADGWYYAEGIIWDDKAQELVNNKDWRVSCSYDFLSYDDAGGVENNIKYDKEFTQLNFTHLALVNNPRYERANIVFNSKDDGEGKWITVHPNGEGSKGTHIFIRKGESLEDAMKRNGWGDNKENKKLSNKEVHEKLNDLREKMRNFAGNRTDKEYLRLEAEYQKTMDEWDISQPNKDFDTDTKESKDLYSDENFKYSANRINQQYGEIPFSKWQKNVQFLLKKYGKTEADFDEAIGAKPFGEKKQDSKKEIDWFDIASNETEILEDIKKNGYDIVKSKEGYNIADKTGQKLYASDIKEYPDFVKKVAEDYIYNPDKSGKQPDTKEKKYTWEDKEYTADELIKKGFEPIKYSGSIYKDDPLTYLQKYSDDGKTLHRVPISEEEYSKLSDKKGASKQDGADKSTVRQNYDRLEGQLKELKQEYKKGNLSEAQKYALDYVMKSVRKEMSDIKKYYPDEFKDMGSKSTKETKAEKIAKAKKSLDQNTFIPQSQKYIIGHNLKGSEASHFIDKINEIEEAIKKAPNMYETDGVKLEDKKPILHYFGGSYDNYVYEIDKETGEMFGAVNMGYGYELGYSSMDEINSVPSIELDLYFNGKQPKELSGSKVDNGFITIDAGTEDERVIWVPFAVLSPKVRDKILKIADAYKEGDETKYDFSHTRTKLTDEQQKHIKSIVEDIQKGFKFKGIAQVDISSEANKGSLGVCCSPDNCSVISLSPQLFSGKYTQEKWEKSIKSGFHPKGTEADMVKSVLVHELGHAITCNSFNSKFWGEIDKIRSDYLKSVKKSDIKNPDFISGYARTNKYEFVAEAFSQGMIAKKYGKYTKDVMECINKHFKSNYQQKLFNAKGDDESPEMYIEEYGFGYPIDEEEYEKFRSSQEAKQKNKANNEKEIDMAIIEELKKLISKVENNKENDEMIENEKTDKRKLIDEVAGIMKSAGCDDEDIRTAIGKMEKIGYDASEDSKADNKKDDKKVENEDEEDKEKVEDLEKDEKEDVDNKCKNSKTSFDKINEIYNSVRTLKEDTSYVSRDQKLKNAEEYFG